MTRSGLIDPAGTPDSAIVLEGVGHRYGQVRSLENVSLQLPRGAAVALVGPDGVGKSTLLGLISGVKRVQQGQVRVLGFDLKRGEIGRAHV